jgi:membrane fusion protein (multidrug efflux system)
LLEVVLNPEGVIFMGLPIRNLLMVALLIISIAISSCGSKDAPAKDNQSAAQSDSTAVNDSTRQDSGKDANKDETKEEDEAIPVEALTVSAGNISSFLYFGATIETEEEVDVYPQVNGIIEKIKAEEGDVVPKGAVLLELDDDEYRLAAEAAKVAYEQSLSEYERAKAIHEKNLTSKNEYETARFNMERAKIEYEQAALTLARSKIKAPIPGVIAERFVKLGDRILTSTKLFHLVNNTKMLATVHVPAKEAQACKLNQRVVLSSDFMKSREFEGWIKRISPVVNRTSGTVKVTVGLQDGRRALKAGMFVNVHIITGTHQNVPLVPKNALVYDGEDKFVYVIQGDTLANRVKLNIGFSDNHHVEPLKNVKPGDKIIVVGQSALKDKSKIKIVRMDSLDVTT